MLLFLSERRPRSCPALLLLSVIGAAGDRRGASATQ